MTSLGAYITADRLEKFLEDEARIIKLTEALRVARKALLRTEPYVGDALATIDKVLDR